MSPRERVEPVPTGNGNSGEAVLVDISSLQQGEGPAANNSFNVVSLSKLRPAEVENLENVLVDSHALFSASVSSVVGSSVRIVVTGQVPFYKFFHAFELENLGQNKKENATQSNKPHPKGKEALTPTEQDVLRLLAEGKNFRQVATALSISDGSVGNFKRKINLKLGTHTQLQAVIASGVYGNRENGQNPNKKIEQRVLSTATIYELSGGSTPENAVALDTLEKSRLETVMNLFSNLDTVLAFRPVFEEGVGGASIVQAVMETTVSTFEFTQAFIPKGEKQKKSDSRRHPSGLTYRQVEVVRFLALGKRIKDVAQELNIAERTVGNFVTNIYEELEINTRAELLLWALKKKLVTFDQVESKDLG